MISFIKKIGRMILFGMDRKPRPYEETVMQSVLQILSKGDQKILQEQFNARERIKRQNEDRMVIYGFEDREALPKMSSLDEDYCLARVALKGGAGAVSVCLMSHKGVLSSMEFAKSPTGFGENPVTVRWVKAGNQHSGYSSSIDAEEHE